jgi:hypothetical protein
VTIDLALKDWILTLFRVTNRKTRNILLPILSHKAGDTRFSFHQRLNEFFLNRSYTPLHQRPRQASLSSLEDALIAN